MLAVLCACGKPHLTDSSQDLSLSAASLDFGPVQVGSTRSLSLVLTNGALSPRTAHVSAAAPFAVDTTLTLAAGASQGVAVPFSPTQQGPAAGLLTVQSDADPVSVPLTGLGLPLAACMHMDDCHDCDGHAFPAGMPCGQANVCLHNATCQHEVCVGDATSCYDGDPCTVDACDPHAGCQHFDGTGLCPAPDDPCQAPACDPQHGCIGIPQPDGAPCGPSDCTTAHVCIGGQCQVQSVPDGYACGRESPCQQKGACHAGACVQPPATPLTPAWSYTPPANVSAVHFEGVSDVQGNLYWLECGSGLSGGPTYDCMLVSYTVTGAKRFRVLHSAGIFIEPPLRQLIAGGLFISVRDDGRLVASFTDDGRAAWSTTLSSPAVYGTKVTDLASDGVQLWALFGGYAYDSELQAVTVAGGAVTQVIPASDALGLVLDEGGNVYTDVSGLASFDPDGKLRFYVNNTTAPPVAVYNGEVFNANGGIHASTDGSALVLAMADFTPAPLTPLMTSGARIVVGGPDQCGWCINCNCPEPINYDVSVRNYVAGDSTVRYETLVASQSGFTDPVLLDTGGVLIAARKSSDTTMTLRELDASGNEQFACPLPEPSPPSGQSVTYEPAVSVVAGHWAVLVHTTCPSCTPRPPPRIDVYPVAANEARAGWTGRHGGPQRMGRPR
jgi:hypothetical protein